MPKQCQRLSAQRGLDNKPTGQYYKNVRKLRDTIYWSCGDDFDTVQGHIDKWKKETERGIKLGSRDTTVRKRQVLIFQNNPFVSPLIDRLKNLYVLEKISRNRRVIISLFRGILTREEINDLGFHVGKECWQAAKKHITSDNFLPGQFPDKLSHKKKLTDELVRQIRDFVYRDDISYEAANRSITKRGAITAVRYFNYSKLKTWKLFQTEFENTTISFSSFLKILPKELKKARKSSDCCHFCVRGKRILNQLERARKIAHQNCENCSKDHECAADNTLTIHKL